MTSPGTQPASKRLVTEERANATYVRVEDYVPGGTSTPAGPESVGAVDLAKFAYRSRTATWSDPSGYTVQTLTDDGKTIVGSNDTAIGISTDDGITWSTVNTFTQVVRGVLLLGDGEVLVSLGSNGERSALMKSSGWAVSPAAATWTQVRQAPSGVTGAYPYGRYSGLVRGAGAHVFVADYGAKTDTRASADLGAVRLLHSADHGATWREAFRLDQWLVARGIDPTASGHHLHGLCWDEYWNRLWVSFGDKAATSGEGGVLYSDNPTDPTPEWGIGYLSSSNPVGEGSNGQGVGMIACRDSLVIMPDGIPAAIFRLPRTGYREHGPLEIVYRVKRLNGTDVTGTGAIGGAPFRAAFPGAPALLPIGHQVDSQGNLSRIVATVDGTTFHEIFRDTASVAIATFGGTSTGIVGPTSSGKIVASSVQDGRYSGLRSTVTIPGYFGGAVAAVAAPTAAPTLTAGTATGTTQPLTWTSVSGATGYTVQYKKTADSSWTLGGSTSALSLTVTDLDPETGYDYRVAATNEGGMGPWSSVVANTTGVAPVATVLWSDSFNRDDAPIVDTEVGGLPYEVVTTGAGVTGATEGHKLRFKFTGNVSGQQFILVDCGQVNGIYTVQNSSINGQTNSDHIGGIVLRWIDAQNYVDLAYQTSSTNSNYRIRKIVAGAVASGIELPVPHTDSDLVVITDNAGVITIVINGTQVYSGAVTEHATSTRKGVRSQYSSNRAAWDSLEFKTLPA